MFGRKEEKVLSRSLLFPWPFIKGPGKWAGSGLSTGEDEIASPQMKNSSHIMRDPLMPLAVCRVLLFHWSEEDASPPSSPLTPISTEAYSTNARTFVYAGRDGMCVCLCSHTHSTHTYVRMKAARCVLCACVHKKSSYAIRFLAHSVRTEVPSGTPC